MKYDYPQVQGGYRWNMLQRIKNEVGIEPNDSGDFMIDDVMRTYVGFTRQLTAAEKIKLDAIMAANPTLPPPSQGPVFKIDDLWEKREAIKASMGLEFRIYYSGTPTDPTSTTDTIELHFNRALTNAEKNRIRTVFAGLMKEA